MSPSAKEYLGDRPYSSCEEYLEDLFIYILICLKTCIEKGDFSDSADADRQLAAQELLSRINKKLKAKAIDEKEDIMEWLSEFAGRRELTRSMGVVYAIESIAEKADVNFILITLGISLLTAMDKSYQQIISALYKDEKINNPTPELCARLYYLRNYTPYKLRKLINENISLLQLLFPEINAGDNMMFSELICDEGLMELLLDNRSYAGLQAVRLKPEADIAPLMFREKELKQLSGLAQTEDFPICIIYGQKGIGKKHLIRHYGLKKALKPVAFNVRAGFSANSSEDMAALIKQLRYIARECMIRSSPLVISGAELLGREDTDQLLEFLKTDVKKYVPQIFILMDCEKFSSRAGGIFTLELADYSQLERYELWKYYSERYKLEADINLYKIANTFIITPGQMIGALEHAYLSAEERIIDERILYKACYHQLDHKLAEKSIKVNASFSWDELKIAKADKRILRDICNCVKNRHIVMNEWNFAGKLPYGAGITVLFSGPPGTGKTMAAQVVANELAMELYKIDVSQIFDKYVGETEKNIRLIFDQAKKSNSILFFDEADAIFNKRLEASSSNDRFANIESSMLLQCIEEYSGISILATNNFNSIDPAFIRRFKYYILFREPDEHVRYEIWKSVIPKEAPRSDDVDLALLAKQFEFTGAVIKNVVLAAAYLAAERKDAISMIDILISIKREMFKNNLILTKEKLGSLGYLFDDI